MSDQLEKVWEVYVQVTGAQRLGRVTARTRREAVDKAWAEFDPDTTDIMPKSLEIQDLSVWEADDE